MQIGHVDTAEKVLVIAEIGNNHEGSQSRAEEMIRRAAYSGADAVKFQTIIPELLVEPGQTDRLVQLKRLCLPPEAFPRLKTVADSCGVVFLSTPFDLESVALLTPLVPAFKVASADNDFHPLLEAVAATQKPILLSTGLADLHQIASARDVIKQTWAARHFSGKLALLHCVASYPTPPEQANLCAIRQLASLAETVGYSDHTPGIEAAVLSVALGARIIEKHFTLDKTCSDFRDHQLSADPRDMEVLVRQIRHTESLLGEGELQPMPCEASVAAQARRSAVATADLPQGAVLGREHVAWLRPGGGIPPSCANELLRKRLRQAVRLGQRIEPSMLD